MKTERVSVEMIRIDGGTQMRVALNEERVGAMESCLTELPPVTVYYDGSNYWLVDGFHRYFAYRHKGAKSIDCLLIKGTQAEAIWAACAANIANDKAGLYRSNADKARAVETALKAKPTLSDRAIGEHVGVDHSTVSRHRKQLTVALQQSKPAGATENAVLPPAAAATTRTGKDGRTINTANIGKAAPAKDPDDFTPEAPTSPTPAPTPAPAPAVAEPLKDKAGQVIADPKLAALYRRRGELIEMMGQISAIKAKLIHGADDRDPLYAHISLAAAQAHCENLRRTLRFATPYAVCPYCGGLGCKVCKDTGLVGETVYQNYTPEDLKV
jgi:uncharacterized ParB-like nuclease family protein